MSEPFDIQSYMTHGVERVVGDIIKATFRNPKESAYMAKFALASRAASRKRRKAEDAGEHIPPFLIASITSQCNLHCAGCYSRCNHATVDAAPVRQLTSEEWLKIFEEADELGISFILLAGGEPMIRRDIIEAAGKRPNILFPVFTNGTFMDKRYFDLFDRCRNLVPIMSIEGEKEITDARRGTGVYDRLIANMDELHRRGLIFGASVTVTTRNIREVASASFLKKLSDRGCKAVILWSLCPSWMTVKSWLPAMQIGIICRMKSPFCGKNTRRWYTYPFQAMKRAAAAVWLPDAASSTSTPKAAQSLVRSLLIQISMYGILPCGKH